MTGISDELVQRMVEVIREMDDAPEVVTRDAILTQRDRWIAKARGIAAELPKPVDPDLIEARKLVCARTSMHNGGGYRKAVMSGSEDDGLAVMNALEAIRLGRRLQAEGR